MVADEASPVVERRRLALELRRLRTEAGKTIYDVADRLECSAGKISRVEMGVVGARIQDVRDMLDLYGVDDRRREQLLDLVRRSRRKPWWHDYASIVPPDSAKLFGLEAGAAAIDEHSVILVPGLLQTERYARAIVSSPPDEPPEIFERRIELRMRRQSLLTRQAPPVVRFLLHQAVLDALIGDLSVMSEQLRHIAEVALLPNVTIRVIPAESGAYTAAGVSFTAFAFAHLADPKIVYLEHLTCNTFIEQPDQVSVYESAFETALDRAATPADSREMILTRARQVAEVVRL